jgi:hypothetical protein
VGAEGELLAFELDGVGVCWEPKQGRLN